MDGGGRSLHLRLRNFRAFKVVDFELSPHITLITGRNGSGKTSILEALYLLGTGRSMSSRRPAELVQTGCESMRAVVVNRQSNEKFTLGAEVSRKTKTRFRLNGEPVRTTSQLALQLPLVPITPITLQLIVGAPSERRSFLDRSCFYSFTDFRHLHQHYRQALKQRNAMLRQQSKDTTTLSALEQAMDRSGQAIDALRRQQVEQLEARLRDGASGLNSAALYRLVPELTLQWQSGWNTSVRLVDVLRDTRERDAKLGYTSVGVHTADLRISSQGRSARVLLSRGQQKMLAVLLLLEAALLSQKPDEVAPLLLIDDLASELDQTSFGAAVELFVGSRLPCIFTLLSDAQYAPGSPHSDAEGHLKTIAHLLPEHSRICLNS